MDRRKRFATAARSAWIVLGLSIVAVWLATDAAHAKGGASLSVTTTGGASGTVVTGLVTVGNSSSKAATIASISESLEVRFPSGTMPPSLPPGSDTGWYNVATASVPSPGTVAANGTVNVPYTVDPCLGGGKNYAGAKDMRSIAVVNVAASAGQAAQVLTAKSLTYALPAKCPVCGNRIVEPGEKCDAGSSGGNCCTSSCRFSPAGSACNDANACTQTDQCQAGVCVGGAPLGCSASDQCHVAGTCNPTTGLCSSPNKANGASCDDANACTQTDSCQSGICRGNNPVTCAASNQCHSGTCNPQTGLCSDSEKVDGTECADGNVCTVVDACADGECVSGDARDCNDHMSCTDDACDETTGCAYTPTETCEACDSEECVACGDQCDVSHDQCESGCWASFFSCLNGCTTTYCAPFCQVDLSRCIAACPAAADCRDACETGNGCADGCISGH